MPGKPFDPTLKALVETSPQDWPALAGLPVGPTEVIDADIATVSGAGDKVLRVRAAEPYLLHLEFQAGHDAAGLPRKLHVRSVLLENRHELPVHSTAILLRPEADSPVLTGERRLALAGQPAYDVFHYQVVRVWQLPPERLLRGGLGTLPLAPISAVTHAEVPNIIKRMERRLQSRRARPHAEHVWSATGLLLGLHYSGEDAQRLLRGVLSMKESSVYQMALREGEAQGEVKGRLAEARRVLRLLGQDLFGAPDAPSVARLEAIQDVGLLEDLMIRVRRCTSWEELLQGLPARRAGRRRG